MKGQKTLFSHESDEWQTPIWLFNKLNEEFHFTLDPCATDYNAKCFLYYTKEQNGLDADWLTNKVFCNPPYSECYEWVKKGYNSAVNGATVVMLLPDRCDRPWFHEFVIPHATEIRFIQRRLTFTRPDKKSTSAPMGSIIVVFKHSELYGFKVDGITSMENKP